MKIPCECGYQIVDGTDCLSHKGHIVPDKLWLDMWEQIDAAIEGSGNAAKDREAACMEVRKIVGRVRRLAWQCPQCGMLHIDDRAHQLQRFTPGSPDTSRAVLGG